MNKQSTVNSMAGVSATHDSAVEHVTGRARYVDDMENAQGLLHVAIGQSPVAHGVLTSLDLDKVRQASGVVDVLTFGDLSHATDIAPVFPGDPLLVDKEISHMGQPVFAVVATSHQLARKAVLLAHMQVDERKPMLEIRTPLKRSIWWLMCWVYPCTG